MPGQKGGFKLALLLTTKAVIRRLILYDTSRPYHFCHSCKSQPSAFDGSEQLHVGTMSNDAARQRSHRSFNWLRQILRLQGIQLAYSCSCEAYRCTRKATEATAMLDLSRAAIEGVPIDARELTPRQLPMMQSEG